MRVKIRVWQKTTIKQKTKIIIGTTCFLLIASGIFVFINVTDVHNTHAAVSGDYRSKSSGDWEDARVWETHNGKSWEQAVVAPINTSNSISVKNGCFISVNTEVSIANLTIEKESTLKLNGASYKVKKQGTEGELNVYGSIDLGYCIVEGDGKFNLYDNAEIIIGAEDGLSKSSLSGNVRVSGVRNYSSLAHYIFKSAAEQHSGNGLPVTISKLTIDNFSNFTLENTLTVTSVLNLQRGIIKTGSNTLILGTSKIKTAMMIRDKGVIAGNFKRWVGKNAMKDILFPMIESENYNAIYMTVNSDDYSGGTLTFSFVPDKITRQGQSANGTARIISIGESGFYKVTASDGLQGGMFKLVTSVGVSLHENKSYWIMNARPKAVEEAKTESIHATASELLNSISIEPSPFSKSFTLKFNLLRASDVEINLYNLKGQILFKDKIIGQESMNTYEFQDQKGMSPGTYFLHITTGNKSEIKKLIKQ